MSSNIKISDDDIIPDYMDNKLELLTVKDIEINGEVSKVVSLRELYNGLGLHPSNWSKWVRRNLVGTAKKDTLFNNGIDYTPIEDSNTGRKLKGNIKMDYAITLRTGQHLAMMAKTDNASRYRDYLLSCEETLVKVRNEMINKLPSSFSEALRMLADTQDMLESVKPKVEFFDTCIDSDTNLYNISEVANIMRQRNVGRNNLYSFLRDKKILNKNNIPYRKYIESGYFEYKVGKVVRMTSKGINWLYSLILKEYGNNTIERSSWNIFDIQGELDKSFSRLKFVEDTHTYTVENNQRVSVTTFNKGYEKYKDWDMIAGRCVGTKNYKGFTKEQIIEKWDNNRDRAANEGTVVHYALEEVVKYMYSCYKIDIDYAFNDKVDTLRNKLYSAVVSKADELSVSNVEVCKNKALYGLKFLIDYSKDYWYIVPELRVYSENYNLAGTIDLPMVSKHTGKLSLGDWKTNANLFKNYSEYLLKPFDTLVANAFNKYQLQLGTYKVLLEDATIFEIDELIVIHLKEDEYFRYDCDDYSKILINCYESE